ncbi:NADPH-dependent medium chain alcohol dehydrogenase, partial [Hortaea werneckii]
MPYPETATGFMIEDQKKWQDFKKQEFKLKTFEDRDVDVAIECCGVCASDLHTINGGWGDAPMPLCVGHEVIGKAIRVGKDVKTIKEGDRVGVGAQIQADLTCANCKADQENYCPNARHRHFRRTIPESIPSAVAAPMMCAGLTVYSPLVRLGAGPGKKVAVLGLGGLGHFAVMWAVALGAEVYVLSHSPKKKEDALKMGAKEFIVTGEENWHKP